MRIDATLEAAQKAMGDAKLRIALSNGAGPYTYYIDAGDDRILSCRHTEQEWSQTALVTVQDSNATLANLDLRGYKGVLSYGYGDNYSASAPLQVTNQRTDSVSGSIRTAFELKGVFDFLKDDKASEAWGASEDYVSPIDSILNYVLVPSQGGYSFFNHTTDYIPTFDSKDTIMDTFAPKDYFRVGFNETRLSVVKKLLAWTGCKARVENDGSDNAVIHFFVPESSSFDYEYNDVASGHNFFGKAVRKRIVIPNYIVVSSHPDYEDQYTGYKADTTNDGDIEIRDHHYFRVTSNTQCKDIATAILSQHQWDAERGSGFVPMNCGQEVMDYVKITDSRVGDNRSGNIGYITRNYSQGVFTMSFGFGKMLLGGTTGPLALMIGKGAEGAVTDEVTMATLLTAYNGLADRFNELLAAVIEIAEYANGQQDNMDAIWEYLEAQRKNAYFVKATIAEQLIIPVWS